MKPKPKFAIKTTVRDTGYVDIAEIEIRYAKDARKKKVLFPRARIEINLHLGHIVVRGLNPDRLMIVPYSSNVVALHQDFP